MLRLATRLSITLFLALSVPAVVRAQTQENGTALDADLSRLEPAVAAQLEELRRVAMELDGEEGEDPRRTAEAYGTLGHLYLVYDLLSPAADAYARARTLDPVDPRWSYYAGYLAESLGDVEAAREGFRTTLELEPTALPALLRLGELELAVGDPEAARTAFERAERVGGETPAVLYGLGRAAAARGEHEEAVSLLERVVEAVPGAGLARYALAQALLRAGRRDDASTLLTDYRPTPVPFPDPYVDRLAEVANRAVLDQVVGLAARSEFPEDRFLDHGMALVGQMRGAREALDGRLASLPTDAARARLGALTAQMEIFAGRDGEAIERFRRALALDPSLTESRVRLANALVRTGDESGALAELDRVVAARPDDPVALLKRAALRMRAERYVDALPDLRRVLALTPDDAEAHDRLAVSLERTGDVAAALDHYRRAGAANPRPDLAARAFTDAGRLAAGLGRSREAVEAYERALTRDPDQVTARLGLGGLHLQEGRATDALEVFERAAELDPRSAPAALGAGIAAVGTAQYARAAAGLTAALRRVPPNPALGLLLARVAAAAPDPAARDGALALQLATSLRQAIPGPETEGTYGLALAESGRFEEAAAAQERALAAARQRGDDGQAALLAEQLAAFRAGRPWRAAEPTQLILLPR